MLVLCAGMPKAGSTLQYNLCKELLGESITTDHGWITGAQFAHGFTPDVGTPDAHTIVKCHSVPRNLAETLGRSELRIVSSYRDLRDVAASDRDFTQGKPFDDTLVTLDFHVIELARLSTYETCLIQRYETMMEDLPTVVRQLADHLSCSPTDDEVAALATRWGVDAVRDRIDTGPNDEPAPAARVGALRRIVGRVVGRSTTATDGSTKWDRETLLWPTHISEAKGRHGRYQGVLSADEVTLIEDRYGDWLRAHDYLA